MTGLHSPWPLFGDDLELARSWLRPQLRGVISLRTGHQAISLGLGDALLDGFRAGESRAEAKALRQWNFRIARLHGEANPYRHLLPEGLLERILDRITHSAITGQPLDVQMNGGLGDHIEALSLLLPWAKAQNCCLNLEMDAERQKQIEPLLPRWNQIQCNKNHEENKVPISVMALRAALASHSESLHYCPWLMQKNANQPIDLNWLCCWRAEGSGDRYSAHSRSVPWVLVQKFYHRLRRLQPNSCVIDITNWTDREASQFRAMGINVLDPRRGTLLGLAERCRISRVVTIDTALVHLCAAAGQRADLLLSTFPDERWQELHRPDHHYGQLIRIWRSSQFGSWSAVLASLTDSVNAAG